MSVDVYKIMLKRLEETEKSAEGGFLFLLRKDGYTYRYFKQDERFLIGKHFYDVSLCSKEWFEKNSPSDFVVEYTGQIRCWFYYLHVLSVALFDKPAYKNSLRYFN